MFSTKFAKLIICSYLLRSQITSEGMTIFIYLGKIAIAILSDSIITTILFVLILVIELKVKKVKKYN